MPGRPLYLSWSQLRAWTECRQKLKLIRAKKRTPMDDIRAFFPGTIVDRAMRHYLNDPNRRPGQMADSIEVVSDQEEILAKETGDGKVKWKNSTDKAGVMLKCKELVNRLEPILDELVLPYEFQPSIRFKVCLDIPYLDGTPTTIYLVGEMDILVRQAPDVWAIWDLKYTENGQYWRKTIGQLAFYELCRKIAFGGETVAAGLIQPLCTQRVVEAKVGPEVENTVLASILSLATSIWSDDMEPTVESVNDCWNCPVRHACVKFQPVADGTMPFLRPQVSAASVLEAP